jgi:hypothetical protein
MLYLYTVGSVSNVLLQLDAVAPTLSHVVCSARSVSNVLVLVDAVAPTLSHVACSARFVSNVLILVDAVAPHSVSCYTYCWVH